MKNLFFLFVALATFLLIGCENRKPLSWETDVFLPLLDDRIGWLDFVEDTLAVLVKDGEPARIIISQSLDLTSGKIAPVLPDTSIEENIGIGNIPVPIPVPTEFPFIIQDDEIPIINLGGSAGAYLREVVVTSGEMVFSVENSIGGILDMSYYLTSCTIDGEQVYHDNISLGAGQTFTKVFNWTMDDDWPNDSGVSWSIEDLNLVAFVQFDGAGQNNKKVYQVEAHAFD